MKLRKQLFTSFLMVAFLPLIIVGFYIFATNLMLAFDLHEQNLRDSTQIQVDLVEDHINRLMVRARQFASSQKVRAACRENIYTESTTTSDLSNEILSFTDETLDKVAIFALLNQDGDILYSSGSNSDSLSLQEHLPRPLSFHKQFIEEISFTDQENSLMICTPVQEGGRITGTFLIVCRTDYLLKLISSHRQLESSNTLIYCGAHQQVVASKLDLSGTLPEVDRHLETGQVTTFTCIVNGQRTLAFYQSLPKTPWGLVSTVSASQIFSQVWSYGFVNIAMLLVVFLIIIVLSRRQSRRVLTPMDQLLKAVETFFLGEGNTFPQTKIDPKSEIGYLAEKFAGLSNEISLAQGKLKESNYLYSALLKATYEFRIVIDFPLNTFQCSSGFLPDLLSHAKGSTLSEQLMNFLLGDRHDQKTKAAIQSIAYGRLTEPLEVETCFRLNEQDESNWYRVVAVPVILNGSVCRVVLHFEDITDKKLEELRLIQSSETDPLCGLYNKTAFPLHCRMSGEDCTDALFFIDLDQFKLVNDTLGHTAGDEILIATANAIRAQFREGDVLGRFGGDEFVVFAPGIGRTTAELRAAQLLQAISFHLDTPQKTKLHVTASVGIYIITSPVLLDQAIRLADEAMYHAKESGRNRFYLVQPDHQS